MRKSRLEEKKVNERDQVITFLLQSCDNYKTQLTQLQQTNTELQKRVAELEAEKAAKNPVEPADS